mgnify:CR=1 FL=1
MILNARAENGASSLAGRSSDCWESGSMPPSRIGRAGRKSRDRPRRVRRSSMPRRRCRARPPPGRRGLAPDSRDATPRVRPSIPAAAIGVAPMLVQGADHLDAPTVKTDKRIDITDIYAFQFYKRLTQSKHLWLRATGTSLNLAGFRSAASSRSRRRGSLPSCPRSAGRGFPAD